MSEPSLLELVNRKNELMKQMSVNISKPFPDILPSGSTRGFQKQAGITLPRSHVNIARFYDWSVDVADCMSVSELYWDLSKHLKHESRAQHANGRWKLTGLKGLANDRNILTKGEEGIILGICKNRGDMAKSTDVRETMMRNGNPSHRPRHYDAWNIGKEMSHNKLFQSLRSKNNDTSGFSTFRYTHSEADQGNTPGLSQTEYPEVLAGPLCLVCSRNNGCTDSPRYQIDIESRRKVMTVYSKLQKSNFTKQSHSRSASIKHHICHNNIDMIFTPGFNSEQVRHRHSMLYNNTAGEMVFPPTPPTTPNTKLRSVSLGDYASDGNSKMNSPTEELTQQTVGTNSSSIRLDRTPRILHRRKTILNVFLPSATNDTDYRPSERERLISSENSDYRRCAVERVISESRD